MQLSKKNEKSPTFSRKIIGEKSFPKLPVLHNQAKRKKKAK